MTSKGNDSRIRRAKAILKTHLRNKWKRYNRHAKRWHKLQEGFWVECVHPNPKSHLPFSTITEEGVIWWGVNWDGPQELLEDLPREVQLALSIISQIPEAERREFLLKTERGFNPLFTPNP